MNKTELKVRAASLAAFAGATVGVTVLQTLSPDWIEALPLWLQAPAAGVVLAVVTWLAGWAAKSRPGYLSESTVKAAQAEVAGRIRR